MSFLSEDALADLGLASYGKNVRISPRASIHGAENIHIGSNVRIDDFCVLSGGADGIQVGDFVHIAAYVGIFGAARVSIADFCGLSSRVIVYSSNDDYSGGALTGPTIPDELRNVDSRPVFLDRHCLVGSGSTLLPGTTMGLGSALGAMSLGPTVMNEFTIYAGIPAQAIRPRSRDLLGLERVFRQRIPAE